MGWKERREVKMQNCGKETHVILDTMSEVEGRYKLIRVERIVGGIPATTYEQTFDLEAGVEYFREMVTEALLTDYRHGDADGARIIASFDTGEDT